MSHPKSIWKGSTKYHIPAAPAVKQPKPFVVWEETRGRGMGWHADCRDCGRHFVALHRTQLHLVASDTGRCYSCRDLARSTDSSNNKTGRPDTVRPPTVAAVTRKGAIEVPRPVTRDLWTRGRDHALHSEKDPRRLRRTGLETAHLGRVVRNRHEARFSITEASTCIRLKVSRYPYWSCCFRPVILEGGALPTRPHDNDVCPKAVARNKMAQHCRAEADQRDQLESRASRRRERLLESRESNRDRMTKGFGGPQHLGATEPPSS